MLAIGASAQRIRCLRDSFAHSSTLLKLQGIRGTELVCAALRGGLYRHCAILLMSDSAGAVGVRFVASQ
jgi:hypothetical protein